MTSLLNPYLGFKDNAAQAMEFYQGVFGGQLDVNKFSDFGDENAPDGVMHAKLETPAGFTLMASDTPPGAEFQQGPSNITISLSGDDDAELRGYWDQLADGGQVSMPLEKQMWGDVFGMVTDKFGIAWMVNIAQQS